MIPQVLPQRYLHCRITWLEILRHDCIRLLEGVGYKQAVQRAGVPPKVASKILRRWRSAWLYATHKEMAGLVRDLRQRV